MDEQRTGTDESRTAHRVRFTRLVARPDPDIDLALGALLIAGHGRPPIDEGASIGCLDTIAERVRIRLDAGDAPRVIVDRLHDVLYRELAVRGPTVAELGDPVNIFGGRLN